MSRFTVIVKDTESGAILHQSEGNSVIAGTADGTSAEIFFPAPSSEDEAMVLISAAESAFGGIVGE